MEVPPTTFRRFAKGGSPLSLTTVKRYYQVIDKALDNFYNDSLEVKDLMIPIDEMGATTPDSFRVGLYQARRYLGTKWDVIPDSVKRMLKYKKEDYKMFYDLIKIRITQTALIIAFPGSEVFKHFRTVNANISRADWKTKLMDFLNNSSEEILKWDGMSFSSEDMDYVKQILSSVKCQYQLDKMSLFIVKE